MPISADIGIIGAGCTVPAPRTTWPGVACRPSCSSAAPGSAALTPADLAARFPALDLEDTAVGVREEHNGFADPYRTALGYAAARILG
ncbi:hypothetical protein [Dactylosporangium sp. NPDC000521]|uniref:hypothetical protein n=1 Tax=Dactylosporangium sp. NPDC000521 TaxID=3363975 RepID=UPI0036B7F29F